MECLRNGFSTGVVLGGRYQTVSPLNHGSFGMVFMAKDLHTQQTVAIKCLTKSAAANDAGFGLAIDDKSEELILHERLGSHPNIVNLLDSFETEAHVYLVLEFCQRGDLYEAIKFGHGPLETEHVRCFMLELVDAVAYIHAKGIYHRDIKPENIFLTQSGAMKLGDFGLATTDQWTFESTVGSDRYMSPEQYDSAGAGYSPAQADVWAVGICLLNILFSRNPFSTPTEADPLFLDFSRDKQSLFDVFPSMSQDTYEVIVQCMSMDPKKRSLEGAREALTRVVSFTTLDEVLDDFCSSDRRVGASFNREPLRTPSIQSPQIDSGAFPWAKALQASPQKAITRQLSVIRDDESYSEDLFSKSGGTADWLSGQGETPSMDSMLDSSFPPSMQSLVPTRAGGLAQHPGFSGPTIAGSLPINMTRPRVQPAMSIVFGGRKDVMSKSWSDMWEEDTEEEEQARHMLTQLNSRTWSNESKRAATTDDDDTPRIGQSPVTKSAVPSVDHEIPSIDSALSALDLHEDDGAHDGVFYMESSPSKEQPPSPGHHYPVTKRGMDKWAQLGERRRAVTGGGSRIHPSMGDMKSGAGMGAGAGAGTGFFPSVSQGYGHGVSDIYGHSSPNTYLFNNTNGRNNPSTNHVHAANGKWNNNHAVNINKDRDRVKECPWGKGRDRDWKVDWRKEKRSPFGGIEWVGGWQEARS